MAEAVIAKVDSANVCQLPEEGDSREPSPSQNPPGSAGSGKRVAVTSLSSSSSEGENTDTEDQIPPSPCSSTSSGPIYVRPPGFRHHGQEVQIFTVTNKPSTSVKLKKKVRRQLLTTDNLSNFVKEDGSESIRTADVHPSPPKNSPRGSGVMGKLGFTGTKPKARKEPLPMKLRALPQSFWQQPNSVNSASPGAMYAVLPPLCKPDQSGSDITEMRPVTPPSDVESSKDKEKEPEKIKIDGNNNNNCNKVKADSPQDVPKKPLRRPTRILKVSPTTTELLCKLFDGVKAGEKKKSIRRRGRPKHEPCPSHSKHLIRDDPYMVEALPVLSLETSRQGTAPATQISFVSVKSGGRTFTLPSLNVEQNYSAMLSDVVKAL